MACGPATSRSHARGRPPTWLSVAHPRRSSGTPALLRYYSTAAGRAIGARCGSRLRLRGEAHQEHVGAASALESGGPEVAGELEYAGAHDRVLEGGDGIALVGAGAAEAARPDVRAVGGELEQEGVLAALGREQRRAAEASRDAYARALRARGFGPITTEIREAPPFYYAEEYHQQYLAKNPDGYCGLGGTGVSCPIGTGVHA